MTRATWSCAFIATHALLMVGCVRAYKPPSASEPHAVVKLRRTYESTAGVMLREHADVGEFRAFDSHQHALEASQAKTDAVLVYPVPATVVFGGTFFHNEMRQVQETYYVQEPYSSTESYNCGTGTSYRTCTRSVTQYRSVAKTRWVTRDEVVVDSTCESSTSLAPADGHIYLLQYTYQDRGVCSLACYEQIPQGADRFDQRPCPVATPAK